MAIPSFLEPVQDGDNFYVDGGVTNNLPVDTAIEMGADIVIAVDIGANPSEIGNNSNVVAVLDKISTYNGNKNVNAQKSFPWDKSAPKAQGIPQYLPSILCLGIVSS